MLLHVDASGTLLAGFGRPGLSGDGLHRPADMDFTESGDIVVLDWGNHRAMILTRTGEFRNACGAGLFVRPARYESED
jgi:hypothetical protein